MNELKIMIKIIFRVFGYYLNAKQNSKHKIKTTNDANIRQIRYFRWFLKLLI